MNIRHQFGGISKIAVPRETSRTNVSNIILGRVCPTLCSMDPFLLRQSLALAFSQLKLGKLYGRMEWDFTRFPEMIHHVSSIVAFSIIFHILLMLKILTE